MKAGTLPLSDVRVLDSGYTVVGLIADLILANLGFSPAKID
jgi:crotonobetainyl-CoA:carnitine CoA-transferase CaiB-like acyl-CoA transferase